MLVDLTIDVAEYERRKGICKEHGFDERMLSAHPDNHVELGVYRCGCGHNFDKKEFLETQGLSYEDEYLAMVRTWLEPYGDDVPRVTLDVDSQYGVSDNIEQIKEYYKEWFDSSETKWVITVTPVFQHKENAGKGGGWRWHKWGPYIGNLEPKYEYLDDEDFGEDFQGYVLCYHIYPVKDVVLSK